MSRNDTITYRSETDGVCHHEFSASGRQETVFTSVDIVSPPHNGSLAKQGPLKAIYRAKPGFKGKDSYTLRVCGKQLAGSGCATVNYDMTVY